MWVASSLNVMLICLSHLFWRISFSGSSVLSWISLMQFSSGDFFHRFFWFSLANSSACFNSSRHGSFS